MPADLGTGGAVSKDGDGAVNEEEIKRVVRATLLEIGMNTSDPDAVTEMQEDFAHLRRSRKGAEEVGKWVKRGLIGSGISAGLYVAWEGIKSAVRLKGGG